LRAEADHADMTRSRKQHKPVNLHFLSMKFFRAYAANIHVSIYWLTKGVAFTKLLLLWCMYCWHKWLSCLQVVTKSQKQQILESCHASGPDALNHFDQKETQANVTKYYYWPRMVDDVKLFCQSCEQCKEGSR